MDLLSITNKGYDIKEIILIVISTRTPGQLMHKPDSDTS